MYHTKAIYAEDLLSLYCANEDETIGHINGSECYIQQGRFRDKEKPINKLAIGLYKFHKSQRT